MEILSLADCTIYKTRKPAQLFQKPADSTSVILSVDSSLRVLWCPESIHVSRMPSVTLSRAGIHNTWHTSAEIWRWEGFAWTISEKLGHHIDIIPSWDHPGCICLLPIPLNLKDHHILLGGGGHPKPKILAIGLILYSHCRKTEGAISSIWGYKYHWTQTWVSRLPKGTLLINVTSIINGKQNHVDKPKVLCTKTDSNFWMIDWIGN